MENVMYFKSEQVAETYLSCNPEEDNGFDYEQNDNYEYIGKTLYYDSGLVNIDKMIEKLQEMKQKGANYAVVDYHCDHQEYDIYGVDFQKATDDEVAQELAKIAKKVESKKNAEIALLEKKLQDLKNA